MIELLNLMWSLRENQEQLVNGPGIDAMLDAFHDMKSRGNPAEEKNDYGFNAGDWTAYHRIVGMNDLSDGVPLPIANQILGILNHYKNSQLKGRFDQIYQAVLADIKKSHGDKVETGEKVIIYANEPKQYGKTRIYVPGGINRSQVIRINKHLNDFFQKQGFRMERDNYNKLSYGHIAFKYFSKDKNNLNSYWLHPDVMQGVLDVLKADGAQIEVKGHLDAPTAPTAVDPVQAARAAADRLPPLQIVEPNLRKTDWGSKLIVSYDIGFQKNQELRKVLDVAGLWRKAIGWIGNEKGRPIYGIDPMYLNYDRFLSIMGKYMDISALKEFTAQHGARINQELEQQRLVGAESMTFENLPKSAMNVKINYRALEQHDKAILKQMVIFIFPDAKYGNYTWTIDGDYNQYVKFGRLLKQHGYNVDKLRELIKEKLQRGEIQKDEIDGELPEGFNDHVQDMLPNSEYTYYKEQREGVGFLYGNRSAVLGDSTGLGKTIQLIGAAELKMMAHDYSFHTLFFTINDQLVNQVAKEIVAVCGPEAEGEISFDPMNPKRWTILKYSTFSNGSNIPAIVEKVASTNFGIVIFDELHKLKHQKSARSTNIETATKRIKIRWGASATISANKPMDVRNQLRLLNHHLGQIPEKRFKAEFAGRTKGLDSEAAEEAKIAAAENLNKWLILSGVYIRRNKEDVKEMPNLTVGTDDAQIDRAAYQQRANERIKKLKDPELPISQLGAHRLELAVAKVPHTVEKVMQLVKKGERVVVFTGFIEAARQLHQELKQRLISIGGKLLTYTSDTSAGDRRKVKKLFTEDQSYKVLLMSLKMGGTGIDFPNAARHMVINDYDWTPESAEQSEGRIYRINTTHPVQIHYVVAPGTLDASLFEMVQQKRKIAGIIQQWRREYVAEKDVSKAKEDLRKIIDAQKELNRLDQQMMQTVLKNEGFRFDSFKTFNEFRKDVSLFFNDVFEEEDYSVNI